MTCGVVFVFSSRVARTMGKHSRRRKTDGEAEYKFHSTYLPYFTNYCTARDDSHTKSKPTPPWGRFPEILEFNDRNSDGAVTHNLISKSRRCHCWLGFSKTVSLPYSKHQKRSASIQVIPVATYCTVCTIDVQ